MTPSREQEERSIAAFLETYNTVTGCTYRLTEQPDHDNRTTPDIDALAECPPHPLLAIEHTTIESHHGQRQAWARFTKHIAPIEKQLWGRFPFCFDLIVPDAALSVRAKRAEVASEIESLFLTEAGNLPLGSTTLQLSSVAERITIRKRESTLHVVYTMRSAPEKDILDLLATGMDKALDHKHPELCEYKDHGATSIVLLESFDVALINEGILGTATLSALERKPRPGVDQVWLAWILGADCHVHCLYGPEDIQKRVREHVYGVLADM